MKKWKVEQTDCLADNPDFHTAMQDENGIWKQKMILVDKNNKPTGSFTYFYCECYRCLEKRKK